jgi:2',3'-cyclic-nucleotide 2'-phosphodiesterase (5'-nucleotidase family)
MICIFLPAYPYCRRKKTCGQSQNRSIEVANEFLTTRRIFLRDTGALLGSTAMGIQADGENFRTVSISHTTNLHGRILSNHTYAGTEIIGGLARCATRISQWRRESPHSLLVDIGDFYHGTFGTGDLPAGDITVGACWKLLPYEARLVTADFGARDLIEIIKEIPNEFLERHADEAILVAIAR